MPVRKGVNTRFQSEKKKNFRSNLYALNIWNFETTRYFSNDFLKSIFWNAVHSSPDRYLPISLSNLNKHVSMLPSYVFMVRIYDDFLVLRLNFHNIRNAALKRLSSPTFYLSILFSLTIKINQWARLNLTVVVKFPLWLLQLYFINLAFSTWLPITL